MPEDPHADVTKHRRVREVLAEAVEELGGHERPGQVAMAEAVADAMAHEKLNEGIKQFVADTETLEQLIRSLQG